jgi:hypothetical protein
MQRASGGGVSEVVFTGKDSMQSFVLGTRIVFPWSLNPLLSLQVSGWQQTATSCEHACICSTAAAGAAAGASVLCWLGNIAHTFAVPFKTRCSFHVQCSSHSADVRLHAAEQNHRY